MADTDRAAFWSEKYQTGGDGWELGQAAPPLAAYFAGAAEPAGVAAVLGCGRGHEVLLLAERGYRAVGFDFAPEAIAAGRAAAARAGLVDAAQFVEADIFALADSERAGTFDLLVEHTCYCAIDPGRRADYAAVASALLRPGGRLVGLFWDHGRPGGPPFSTSPDDVRARFGRALTIESLDPAVGSVSSRANQEWLLVASKPVR